MARDVAGRVALVPGSGGRIGRLGLYRQWAGPSGREKEFRRLHWVFWFEQVGQELVEPLRPGAICPAIVLWRSGWNILVEAAMALESRARWRLQRESGEVTGTKKQADVLIRPHRAAALVRLRG